MQPLTAEQERRLRAAPYTYAALGATERHEAPAGYRSTHLRLDLDQPFERALETLMTWRMHERAGLRVRASSPRVVAGAALAHLQVTAFSRPGRWFTALAGPLAGLVQDEIVEKYRRALST